MHDIITGTPADLTYLHPIVREAWMVVWAITSAALVLILGWMGLSFTIQEHLGRVPAGWREMVPRLLLGLVAAATSLWWCALVLDVADAVSGFVAASLDLSAGDLLRSSAQTLLTAVEVGSVGMALVLALLYLVYGFFVLYVLLQLIMRLALIDLLVVLAPIALGLWILPHTAGWGRHWLRLFLTTVFQQAIQLIALAMGFGMLNQFADIAAFEPIQDLVWKLLLSQRLGPIRGGAARLPRCAPWPKRLPDSQGGWRRRWSRAGWRSGGHRHRRGPPHSPAGTRSGRP